ncbi:hypothetical protein ACSLVQ_27470, partial [Klebsiella pneumoniae]|uniref:hypothetical protein n=1 Tax=Klebsiella pneumoniae TaxID=573 RepID=UPI003EDE9BF5
IKRVVICSGKIYFDLYEEREKQNIKDIAFVRIEEYYPFPANELAKALKRYKNAQVIWCQEEPKNMGAWYYINDKIEECLLSIHHKFTRPTYMGRP